MGSKALVLFYGFCIGLAVLYLNFSRKAETTASNTKGNAQQLLAYVGSDPS